MSKTIYKYGLSSDGVVMMPLNAVVLSIQGQHGKAQIWAVVDDEDKILVERRYNVYGTGHPLPDDPGRFVSTFQLNGGEMVFHVFEGAEETS